MTSEYDILVVGAGIFGVTAALELNARGHGVALLDPGPLLHLLAASTDISKVVRMEYGADEEYMTLTEQAREGWLRWNEEFGTPLYHDIGVTMLTRAPMSPGGYEYESYQLMLKRGHTPERLDSTQIAKRLPAWDAETYVDGFFNAEGGYVESGRAMETLINKASREGVTIYAGHTVDALIEGAGRVIGVRTREDETFSAGEVVIAAGAWTPLLVPELAPVMKSVGQPVFHLKPTDPSLFEPPRFFVFAADIANTGWYGFPLHPKEGVVKIAHHGVGQRLHPSTDERAVTDTDVQQLRAFLVEAFPTLVDAPIVYTRRCLYCDTPDEHFWITRHPDRNGLTVAAGGSGHGFKFGPVLGDLIADAVEAKPNPSLQKFRWRTLAPETAGEEASRHHIQD